MRQVGFSFDPNPEVQFGSEVGAVAVSTYRQVPFWCLYARAAVLNIQELGAGSPNGKVNLSAVRWLMQQGRGEV